MTNSNSIAIIALIVSTFSMAVSILAWLEQRASRVADHRPRVEIHTSLARQIVKSADDATFVIRNTIENTGTALAARLQANEQLIVTNSLDYAAQEFSNKLCRRNLVYELDPPQLYPHDKDAWTVWHDAHNSENIVNPNPFFKAHGLNVGNSDVDETYVIGCVIYGSYESDDSFGETYAFLVFACDQKTPHCGALGINSPNGPPSNIIMRRAFIH